MWHRLHFHVVFKGDDWRGTPKGDRLERGMAAVGAKVVYFPYTQEISSSKIRKGMQPPVAIPARLASEPGESPRFRSGEA
jgi:hypothetical protein